MSKSTVKTIKAQELGKQSIVTLRTWISQASAFKFWKKPAIKRESILPPAWIIARRAADMLYLDWRVFAGISVLYAVFTFSLTRVFSSGSSAASQISGVYQVLFALFCSLAFIWAMRNVLSRRTHAGIREAFYKGMYPLIPFVLICTVIILQLLPAVIGTGLFSLAITYGIAAHLIDQIVLGLLCVVCITLSLYLVTSSLFALYIAALPDMYPLQALRSSWDLVRNRRWTVLRKILFLPLATIVVFSVILIPVIITATGAAMWVYYGLATLLLPVFHAYMYTLYRELLK